MRFWIQGDTRAVENSSSLDRAGNSAATPLAAGGVE